MITYFNFWTQAFDFSSRTRRWHYWLVFIINAIIYSGLVYIDVDIATGKMNSHYSDIFNLITLIPSLSIMVRRLHDSGRSGWWMLLIVTIVGIPILLVIVFFFAGTRGNNIYGHDPKARASFKKNSAKPASSNTRDLRNIK